MAHYQSKIPLWRRLGGGSLSVSIIIHAVILMLGLFWILHVIPPEKEKVVDFTSSGGRAADASNPQSVRKHSISEKKSAQRVAAANVISRLTLPDPEMEIGSSLASLGSLGGNLSAGGLGGREMESEPVKGMGSGRA